ncbi:hypothetical protein ACLB2K_052931 [Fragaria x ananassa]
MRTSSLARVITEPIVDDIDGIAWPGHPRLISQLKWPPGFCNGNFGVRCKEIIDYSNRLFLWSAEGDCCYWTGVVCDDAADHILELHLSDSYYSSRLSVVLFLIIATTSFCNGNFGLRCKEIIDYSNRLFLWSAEGDCCYRTGVVCDDAADHILELHLSDSYYSSRLSVVLFLIIATTSFCNGNFGVRCKEIIDYSNRLFLWSAEGDCCYWTGVVCDDAADHILELHLSDSYYSSRLSGAEFGGMIPYQLRNLSNLLDLRLDEMIFGLEETVATGLELSVMMQQITSWSSTSVILITALD